MFKHLSIRVAWHDNLWNGSVCSNPNNNSYCTNLPRIYEQKKDNEPANKAWWQMTSEELPPCKAEGGAFMNPKEYNRSFSHPYGYNETHNHLAKTQFPVSPFTTFAVPFWWMLNSNQKAIDNEFPDLPYNEFPKTFYSSWVFSEPRQHAILDLFFKPIEKNKSLVVFYTKSGNPIDENCRRLLIGIGNIIDKSPVLHYNKLKSGTDYPIWDRKISHSIRPNTDPNNYKGFLIPYHEYLALEDKQYKIKGTLKSKQELLDEIKVSLVETGDDESRIVDFSHGSQWINNRNMLAIINKLRHVIEVIREHGIVEGPWDKRLQWLNDQIGVIKESMGAFPSFSQALVAFGFKKAHLFTYDIYTLKICEAKDNPWDTFEDAIYGRERQLLNKPYSKEFGEIKIIWESLSSDDKKLLILLSRFDLSTKQIERWYDAAKRKANGYSSTTKQLLSNPYLIVEEDNPKVSEYRISVETIDSGVFEDRAIQGDCVPEPEYRFDSKLDRRRIRALVITLLKDLALQGDTLLSLFEIRERLTSLSMNDDTDIPVNYLEAHIEYLKEKLVHLNSENINALQLKIYDQIETELSKKFLARASKSVPSLGEKWEELIVQTIKDNKGKYDKNNKRHVDALADQSKALEQITTRKLSILNGPAGTGKTSVMGALVRSKKLSDKGILLLAPTGKARVRLQKMTNQESLTIAQFLTRQKRFDWSRMKPLFNGKEQYKGEKTVIIDECSMLTEDDFYAVFQALDLLHVERIVLVGDPYQLPPIGAGRPFADLCSWLEGPFEKNDEERKKASGALAKLEVVVRTKSGADSDTLMLASWFAGRKGAKNNDAIFDKIGNNTLLNDLRIELWENPDDIQNLIQKIINEEFQIDENNLVEGFNKVLGQLNGKFPIENPEVVENFQMLTPVKAPVWGTSSINRFIQQKYRDRPKPENYWEKTLGDQQIWKGDKIIQLKNEKRDGYYKSKEKEVQLSNGQIGYVVSFYKGYGNAAFAGLEDHTVGYNSSDFNEDGGKIELAYAITIHKSQGSDFNLVFFILPKTGRLLSRELLYTGLTRAKEKLVLLVEGVSSSWIFNYSKGEASETAKRNTHLFKTDIRESRGSIPFIQNLIHKTKGGIYVRSKSEVIVANLLHDAEIPFEYERQYDTENGWRLPDFTFRSADDEIVILEHLGMLHKPFYREEWEQKRRFYLNNGFVEGNNLFTTTEDANGAIDSETINKTIITKIKRLI